MDPVSRSRGSRTGAGACLSCIVVVVGVVAGAVYALDLAPVASSAAFCVVGLVAVVSTLVGPALHRPAQRLPWRMVAGAVALFVTGALIRPWAAAQHGAAMAAADAVVIPGYLLMLAGLALLLRRRGGAQRHAVLDGLVVALGAASVSITAFAVPAADVPGRPPWFGALAACYPMLDVLVLLVLLNLALATRTDRPAWRFLVVALVSLLAGDLGYAAMGASGRLVGPVWIDLPFVVALACLSAAMLHPSMVEIGAADLRKVQAWSRRRVMALVPALLAPLHVVLLGSQPFGVRVALACVAAAGTLAVLVRAGSAVASYAEAQRRAREQAHRDALTGLPNRTVLSAEILPTLLERSRTLEGAALWALFCDLDGFKYVNDSWGHETGDLLLVEVSERLSEIVPGGAVLARVGGDEFVLALAGRQEDAEALARSLLRAMTAPVDVAGHVVVMGVSIGLAAATDAAAAGELLRNADTAMYTAKDAGRGRFVVFDDRMREQIRARVEMELALRHALAAGQLWVAYQPVVSLRDGRVLGAEALVRWSHPRLGEVRPDQFVPLAEECGLIGEVGRLVLETALVELGRWRRAGLVADDFTVSVNVSAWQLRDPTFVLQVETALRAAGVPPQAVTLEMTESAMVDPSGVCAEVLGKLRAFGLRLAVDDFGTGYSALGYLRDFPVSVVKVDRSFVSPLGVSPDAHALVAAIAAMSGALRLDVVAEGVETEAQREALLGMGVERAQGWLFARALAPADFVEHVRTSEAAAAGSVAVPSA